jgi:hypothetical protein
MRKQRILLFVGLMIFSLSGINGQSSPDNQPKLEKIIPVSPTAASIAKYGNIPVNYFTGSPTVSIPLYELNSGNLKVPIALNYQFNGLKVEEIASWVGLGWSLQAGGVISRTVRGTADEVGNGYMVIPASNQMTTKFIIDNRFNPTYQNDINYTLTQAGKGLYDLEPDIFYFNFPGGSGKFFYNQEDQKFYSLPAQNIKISFSNGTFTLITENGNRFYFTATETTTANAPQCTGNPSQAGSSMNVTSWYLTRIENMTQTDVVTFDYEDTYYSFDNISTSSKYNLIQQTGTYASGTPPTNFQDQVCYQTTTIAGKRLTYIHFRNGYLKLTASTGSRSDLPGEKSLIKTELFNNSNELIRGHLFEYGYFGSGMANEQRLKLTAVKELNTSGTTNIPPYTIEYEESGTFPSRMSYAQDHWGYYNGITSNTSLIPPMLYYTASGEQYAAGDDRKPYFDFAKLGSIKKITYPTGGTTEFEFENNEVKDAAIQPEFTWHTFSIEGDHNGGLQTEYVGTFQIDEPSNIYNFNNPNGGVYADIFYEAIGCSFPSGASTCAILTLEGISSGTPSYGPFTGPVTGRYLPNGSYRLRAIFNQNPPLFEDFYFAVKWRQPVINSSNLVGGLRIKKLTDYDGIDPAKKILRKFTYTSDADNLSSGRMCGYPNSYIIDFNHEFYSSEYVSDACFEYELYRTLKKRVSTSNYPLVAHQGGYVGYEQVNVLLGENGEGGKTVYKYQYVPDDVVGFPATATSREWERGKLLEEKIYKNSSPAFSILKENSVIYKDLKDYDINLTKNAYGLKSSFNVGVTIAAGPCGELAWLQRENEALIPLVTEYETITGDLVPLSNQSISYDGNGQMVTVREFDYNGKNYLQKEIKSANSKGDILYNRIKYNVDYTLAGNNPSWLDQLKSKNLSAVPIETLNCIKYANGITYVTGGVLSYFKSGQPLPDKSFYLDISSPVLLSSFVESYVDGSGNFIKDGRYKEIISYNFYDANNNLLEQQKKDDFKYGYLWDYNYSFPVAQCINADLNAFAYTSFEADGKGNWTFSGTPVNDGTAPTGKKAYELSTGSITKSISSSATYIISYWRPLAYGALSITGTQAGYPLVGRIANGWKYYEHKISGQSAISLSGSGQIDELRLYPVNSQMTTFTYDPLIGMTSQCDLNNQITYYEYDDAGRLKLVRDQNRYILKKYCYNFAGEQEQCGVDMTPDWQNTATAIRCKTVAGINTGEREREQKDMNSHSLTFNSTRWVVVDVNCSTCPKPANWVATGSYRCAKDGNNDNTGVQERQEQDQESCSATYNQTRWVFHAYNYTACPLPCNSSTCSGINKKCINGTCETGTRYNKSTVKVNISGTFYWRCTFYYCFSDGSVSADQTEDNVSPCSPISNCLL